MRQIVRCVALFLIAVPLSAATIEVRPSFATSTDMVTIFVSEFVTCPPPPQITRSGNTFTIRIDPGICLIPSFERTFDFPVGPLQPGDYEVIVNPPQRTGYAAFFVHDSAPQIFVRGQAVGPATGGTEVIIDPGDAGVCFGPDPSVCPVPAVSFNGVPAQVIREKFVTGTLAVIAPPNPKGIAEVVVVGSREPRRGRVFRYYDPDEAPLPTMFERVLVPVWTFGPGAFGSNWTTEVWTLNASQYDLEPYRHARMPRSTTAQLSSGASRSGGVLFFPPRDFSSQIQFGSLVRDTSRQAEDWGTEVPVVRESEFRTAPFSLLNVPVDVKFRQTLRIYDADSVEGPATLLVFSMETGEQLGGFVTVPLRSANPCRRFEPCASDDPASATVDLMKFFPDLRPGRRVRIMVIPFMSARLWAFATITNNQTQHVTVITPG